MAIVILFARLLLAAVFVWPGSPARRPRGLSPGGSRTSGVPSALAAPLSVLLPLAELAVAVALIPPPRPLWAPVLWYSCSSSLPVSAPPGARPQARLPLLRPTPPAPAGHVARNGVLAAIAAFVVWQGLEGEVGPSVIGRLGALSTTQLLIVVGGTVVLAVAAVVLPFGVLSRTGGSWRGSTLENRLAAASLAPSENGIQSTAGLPLGSPAPTSPSGTLGARRLPSMDYAPAASR